VKLGEDVSVGGTGEGVSVGGEGVDEKRTRFVGQQMQATVTKVTATSKRVRLVDKFAARLFFEEGSDDFRGVAHQAGADALEYT
jgi:hypothetical protein